MQGFIKNVMATYGFIKAGNADYFFHRDSFNGHWNDLVNDFKTSPEISVNFTAEDSPKGPRAVDVTRTAFPNAGR